LTERIKLKILRQQIFSLNKIKGGWLKTIRLLFYFYRKSSKWKAEFRQNGIIINFMPFRRNSTKK